MNDFEKALSKYFYCDTYSIDMVRDYAEIICHQLTQFKGNVDDYEENRAKLTLKSLVSYCKQPHNKNRMYIVSGVQYLSFAWTNIYDVDVTKLFNKFHCEFIQCDPMPIECLEPNLVSSIYFYQNDEVTLCQNIYPAQLASLLISLNKHNEIKFSDFSV